jgi:hypothetical protein
LVPEGVVGGLRGEASMRLVPGRWWGRLTT